MRVSNSIQSLCSAALLCVACLLHACSAGKKLAAVEAAPVTAAPVKDTVAIVAVDSAAIKAGMLNQALRVKYAAVLNTSPDSIVNTKLYAFINDWMGTPFKWAGTDKNGIDCSAFVQRLFSEVYGLAIPRTSAQQLLTERVEAFKSVRHLAEGDLVFFKTMENKQVSHVGIYLCNGMFVNCSTLKGVNISSLYIAYWKKRYVAAGRVKAFMAKNGMARVDESKKAGSVPPGGTITFLK